MWHESLNFDIFYGMCSVLYVPLYSFVFCITEGMKTLKVLREIIGFSPKQLAQLFAAVYSYTNSPIGSY